MTAKESPRRQFTSDNRSGICPEAWAALAGANVDHAPSYGDDAWTARAADLMRQTFETDCDVYFVFNGTAANSLALASLCQSYHSVICHEMAHIETDECGAPEFFSNGTKILVAPGLNGKLTADRIETLVRKRADIHFPKPKVVSLSQATELGTVYTPGEIEALSQAARGLGLRVQMDGARFANAVAAQGCSPADLSWKAGVDVLCFGGTKNGMGLGDAVIFFDRTLSGEFAYRCKQAGQLASKMRFLAAPWAGMLADGSWLRYAAHANTMARRLETEIRKIPSLRILFPVQANSVFVELPVTAVAVLRQLGWSFYTFIGAGGARFMCSWDTTIGDVERLANDLRLCIEANS